MKAHRTQVRLPLPWQQAGDSSNNATFISSFDSQSLAVASSLIAPSFCLQQASLFETSSSLHWRASAESRSSLVARQHTKQRKTLRINGDLRSNPDPGAPPGGRFPIAVALLVAEAVEVGGAAQRAQPVVASERRQGPVAGRRC